jgi:hypothetical protein
MRIITGQGGGRHQGSPHLPVSVSGPCVRPRAQEDQYSKVQSDGQTSLLRPRLVVPRNTCPPLSPSHANSFVIGTAVINAHTSTAVCVECLFLRSPSRAPHRTPSACATRATYPDPPPVVPHPVCVECLIGKQKKPILFKVTEPSHGNKRTHLQGGVKTRWQIPELWFMMTQTKS